MGAFPSGLRGGDAIVALQSVDLASQVFASLRTSVDGCVSKWVARRRRYCCIAIGRLGVTSFCKFAYVCGWVRFQVGCEEETLLLHCNRSTWRHKFLQVCVRLWMGAFPSGLRGGDAIVALQSVDLASQVF